MNWKILIAVVALIALAILLALPAFHRWNAGRVNDIRQEYIIQNAQGRVASYEWFYDMQEQISATRKKAQRSGCPTCSTRTMPARSPRTI